MKLNIWVKPSGVELMLNDEEATEEYARKIGWLPLDETEQGIAAAKATIAKAEAKAKTEVKAKAKPEVKAKAKPA